MTNFNDPRSSHFKEVNRQSAAFRGASLAFSSTPVPPKPLPNTYSGTDGALAAASFAGVGRLRPSCEPGNETATSDIIERSKMMEAPQSFKNPVQRVSGTFYNHEQAPRRTSSREQSPSHIAAVIAASKSKPASKPRASLNTVASRPSSLLRSHSDLSSTSGPTDDRPIAATNSLVKLYESRQISKSVSSEVKPYHNREKSYTFSSPAPLRPSKAVRTVSLVSTPSKHSDPTTVKPSFMGSEGRNDRKDSAAANASPASAGKSPSTAPSSKGHAPPLPPPRRKAKRPVIVGPKGSETSSYTNNSAGSSSSSSYASAVDGLDSPKYVSSRLIEEQEKYRTGDTPPSTLHGRAENNSRPPSRSILKTPSSADKLKYDTGLLKPTREPILSTTSLTPQLTASSLANAMVASSLASSRAPSPSKPPPLLPIRQPKKSTHLFNRHHNSQEQLSRTPSPSKGMRHTMRETSKSSDESETYRHHKGSRIIKKHPHKHHEGDRKRWREQITDKERKRYEGVWAANRGLLLPPTNTTAVINLVVRDIWSRSQLSFNDLEEIWDLVDSQAVGRLEREEFVVGMWLIDQRLKGRKTPVMVSESVWASVRRLSGIQIPKNKH